MPSTRPSLDVGEQQATESPVEAGSPQYINQAKYVIKTGTGVWSDYQVVNHYEFDRHIYMAGISSPAGFQGNQAAFFRLAASTLLLVSDWTAERKGTEPEAPDPSPVDTNLVLLDEHYDPNMMELMANGESVIYRISGTYVYGFKDPKIANMHYGRPPWLDPSIPMTVSSNIWKKDIHIGARKGGATLAAYRL